MQGARRVAAAVLLVQACSSLQCSAFQQAGLRLGLPLRTSVLRPRAAADDTPIIAQPPPVRSIYVVSDASGTTANRVVASLIKQFDTEFCAFGVSPDSKPCGVKTRLCPRVKTAEDALVLVNDATRDEALVFFTLADPDLREHVAGMCRSAGIAHFDLMGPAVKTLSAFLGQSPNGLRSDQLSRTLDDAYFRRVDAVEFTMNCDDGKQPQDLEKADVVLVAPSRCGKTPLSMYLAQEHQLRTANVPLVLNVPPPKQLADIHPRKIFGLSCAAKILYGIRQKRLKRVVGNRSDRYDFGVGAGADYASMPYIKEELAYSHGLYSQHGWHVIDVSNKAVEESAFTILERIGV